MLKFFVHATLDGQKTESIFKCIDSQRGAEINRLIEDIQINIHLIYINIQLFLNWNLIFVW